MAMDKPFACMTFALSAFPGFLKDEMRSCQVGKPCFNLQNVAQI